MFENFEESFKKLLEKYRKIVVFHDYLHFARFLVAVDISQPLQFFRGY